MSMSKKSKFDNILKIDEIATKLTKFGQNCQNLDKIGSNFQFCVIRWIAKKGHVNR